MALDENIEFFIVHIISLGLKIKIVLYLVREVRIVLLRIKKIFKSILAKYLDIINLLSKKLAAKLLKYLKIN